MEPTYFLKDTQTQEEIGWLMVHPDDTIEGEGWCLFECEIRYDEFRGKGWGSSLIKNWVNQVGPNVAVHGPLIHTETKARLHKDYFGIIKSQGEYTLTDPDYFTTLPIIRFLQRNQIKVERIHLGLDDKSFTSYFYGFTT